jgi:NADPH:quinone reductase-like Zn-dependent oxidoreductase
VWKVVVHRPGGYGRLRLEEHPDPAPGPGEVAVEVEAAGVNYADCVVRMGLYAAAKELVGWPITPGFELAGRVAALGSGVEGLREGDPVLGVTRFGAYASRVVLARAGVFARPAGWTAEEAAGFPVVHLTAWYALHRLCALEPGQSVLVHSAAGGVGTALVRLARLAGLRVVGVVGAAHKVEHVRGLGADVVIDKSAQDLWSAVRAAAPEGFAAVFDANGPATLRGSYAHLAPEGRLVVYGFHTMLPRTGGRPNPFLLLAGWLRTPRFGPYDMSLANRSVMAFNLAFLFPRTELLSAAMEALLELAVREDLRPRPIRRFALAAVADAHRALESGTTTGKLVLVPSP